MLLQDHYELCRRAHMGTSFVPEVRAKDYVRQYSEQLSDDLERVKALGGDPADYHTRYERQQRREARAAIDPVEEMRGKIQKAEREQNAMKAANKIVRNRTLSDSEKIAQLAALLNWSEAEAAKVLQPDFCGRVGFPDYLLTNNLANIKRMRGRLAELESKAQAESKEVERPDGIRIVHNAEADRLQIFFLGKPAPEMIDALKRRAFKWSPSNGCWQRQLTANAIAAMREILPA